MKYKQYFSSNLIDQLCEDVFFIFAGNFCHAPRGNKLKIEPYKPTYLVHESVYFYCEHGYDLDGTNVATCLLGGKWDQLPKCTGTSSSLLLLNTVSSNYISFFSFVFSAPWTRRWLLFSLARILQLWRRNHLFLLKQSIPSRSNNTKMQYSWGLGPFYTSEMQRWAIVS